MVRKRARASLVAFLALGLVAPVAGPGSSGASAEGQPGDDVTVAAHGQPFWQALRPDPISDPDDWDTNQPDRTDERWTDADLTAVHFATDEVGYAVGTRGEVLKTHDAGDTWERKRLTSGGNPVGDLRGVHVVSAGVDEAGESTGEDVVVAVGPGGLILQTRDGGATWRRSVVRAPDGRTLDLTVDLHAVRFGGEDVGFAVGDRPPDPDRPGWRLALYTVLRTDDGGRTWERLDSPNTDPDLPPAETFDGSPGDLLAVDFVDERTAVVAGQSRYLRTEDGGESWTSIDGSVAAPGRPQDVTLLPRGEGGGVTGYAVGDYRTGLDILTVHRTTDGFQHADNSGVEQAGRGLFGVVAYAPADAAAGVVEVAHAVGWHGYSTSSIVGRLATGVVMTRTVSAGSGSGAWVVEPVNDWARNQEILRAVSASPGGGTVVAVGDGGLMLRRSTDPTQVPDNLCIPRVLADLAQPPEVEPCPEPTEREDGEVTDPVDGPLSLSDDVAEPGDRLRAIGEGWLVCNGDACRGSQVTLWFVQDGRDPVRLGDAMADERGEFGTDIEVPRTASPGVPTVVRAVGERSGGEPPVAEAELTVPDPGEPVSPPSVHAPELIRQGKPLTVTGTDWRICRPTCEGSAIQLTLEQGSRSFDLGVSLADSYGRLNDKIELPGEVELGEATVRAVADPAPDLGQEATTAVDVRTGCWLTAADHNPELPCLDAFRLALEDGSPLDADASGPAFNLPFLGFVPGIGETDPATGEPAGRLVGIAEPHRDEPARIILYDIGNLEQRGVSGFADHFDDTSADGDETGVVNLGHAPSLSGRCDVAVNPVAGRQCQVARGEAPAAVALDTENHRLYFVLKEDAATLQKQTIVAVSLTGEFPPTTFSLDGEPGDVITHLAVSPRHSVLYAVTASTQIPFSQVAATKAPARNGAIHGIPTWTEDGELRFGPLPEQGGDGKDVAWSVDIGQLCNDTTFSPLTFIGVSTDGRRVHVPCAGVGFTARAWMGATPNGILTVTLPERPERMSPADTADVTQRFEPVPGTTATGEFSGNQVFGDQAAGLLMWRTTDTTLVWDLDRAMWIGRATLRGTGQGDYGASLVAADPDSRQLYLAGGADIPPGSLAYLQVANLPGDFHRRAVDTGLPTRTLGIGTEPGIRPDGVFDPHTRRLVIYHQNGELAVLEDRLPPTLARAAIDPDAATNDIDEVDAFSVDRTGATSAYGVRVWWSGLQGALPGSFFVPGESAPFPPDLENEPPAGLTWDWLFRGSTPHGEHTQRMPWRPDSLERELVSAEVPSASLAAADRALTGRSPRRSAASAVGLGVDDGGDAHQRRGVREWRDAMDTYAVEHGSDDQYEQWSEWWSGEDAQRFDDCVDELWDRILREVDGQRQVHACADFAGFDEWDPRDDPDSLEDRAGLTQPSACVLEQGSAREAANRGSLVVCDPAATVAVAENAFGGDEAFSVDLPGGAALRVEASFTLTHSYLDPDRGMVSEANAFAQGVELGVPGVGTLRIGQVATRAETWAEGRPGSAGSEFTVSYSDVELSGPDGGRIFACDPRGDVTLPVEFPADDDEGDEEGSGVACDVDEVIFRVNQAFGGIVTFSVPARDLDERMVGTPKGAQARVQRDRADYWNDRVLFGVDRDEVSGLQITVVNDGTQFNRYKIDLAGVFAGSNYAIGQPATGLAELPGSLEVSLTDHEGIPLAGGAFEVVADGGAGGAAFSCVTGSDGVGACRFPSLDPGDYQVRQVSAPEGYLRQVDPARVSVSRGLTSTVEFVNNPDGAGVEITLVNPAGERLAGGVFELAHEDAGSASCATDAGGRCDLTRLPLGAYTLTQPGAPDGYEPTEPVTFSLLQPGQVARITVVNGPPGSGVGGATVEIIEIIEGSSSTASSGGGRGPFGMFRDALADAFAFLLRNPLQALLFLMLFGLLFSPVYGLARRMDLIAAEEAT